MRSRPSAAGLRGAGRVREPARQRRRVRAAHRDRHRPASVRSSAGRRAARRCREAEAQSAGCRRARRCPCRLGAAAFICTHADVRVTIPGVASQVAQLPPERRVGARLRRQHDRRASARRWARRAASRRASSTLAGRPGDAWSQIGGRTCSSTKSPGPANGRSTRPERAAEDRLRLRDQVAPGVRRRRSDGARSAEATTRARRLRMDGGGSRWCPYELMIRAIRNAGGTGDPRNRVVATLKAARAPTIKPHTRRRTVRAPATRW